jgi:hypothetical protein
MLIDESPTHEGIDLDIYKNTNKNRDRNLADRAMNGVSLLKIVEEPENRDKLWGFKGML